MSIICPTLKFDLKVAAEVFLSGHIFSRQKGFSNYLTMTNLKQHQEQVNIILSGIANSQLNYVFEVYRFAVKLNITGYVKREGAHSIRILVSGDEETIRKFVSQLDDLCSENIKIDLRHINKMTTYNDFSIL